MRATLYAPSLRRDDAALMPTFHFRPGPGGPLFKQVSRELVWSSVVRWRGGRGDAVAPRSPPRGAHPRAVADRRVQCGAELPSQGACVLALCACAYVRVCVRLVHRPLCVRVSGCVRRWTVCTCEGTRDVDAQHTQVRTAVVLPHGDFVYAPQLIEYKNGSRQLHDAARVMALGRARRPARFACLPLLHRHCTCVLLCMRVYAAHACPPALSRVVFLSPRRLAKSWRGRLTPSSSRHRMGSSCRSCLCFT